MSTFPFDFTIPACVRHKTNLQPRENRTQTVSASSVGLTGSKRPADEYCPSCESDCSHLFRLLYTDLGFCGCADPEAAYDTLGMVLAFLKLKWEEPEKEKVAHWKNCSELIRDQIGSTEGAYCLVMYMLDHAGLTEHGGSVHGSWLTKKGKHYLDLMNTYTYDEVDGTGYPHEGELCGPGCADWEASYEDWEKKQLKKELTKGLPA